MNEVVLETKLPLKLFKRGKVRDVYEAGDMLLMIASDRISAFDCVLPNGIPQKGKILNLISAFWFGFTKDIVSNHVVTTDVKEIIARVPALKEYESMLDGRSMLARKTKPLPVECVVRGYLAGSGWREYQEKGSVCGIELPEGLRQSQRIPHPIFTPATKAVSGHDENISEEKMKEIVGPAVGEALKQKTLEVYGRALEYAETKGLIIADTKLEFGMDGDKVIVIDEMLTPDSSRFWDKGEYVPGHSQKSFDKQPVRDYLDSIDWDKKPPAPPLPDDAVGKTTQRYAEAYRRIAGKEIG